MSDQYMHHAGAATLPTITALPGDAIATALHDLADPIEELAGFGRWWFDRAAMRLALSHNAAAFLDVRAGVHTLEDCFANVVPDDFAALAERLAMAHGTPLPDCEVRVVNEQTGLRWLRMATLPDGVARGPVAGVMWDITAAKHAALRERFSFESTQFLIGTHSLGDALTKVIRLVCESLGWEWGAYWSLEQDQHGGHSLGCKYFWHNPGYPLASFTAESRMLRMGPGQGLIGLVWQTGRASWVEDVATDDSFLRRKGAQECGLHAGYAFPVAYAAANGQRHSPGVLEFFSSLPRQRDAQLPHLSAAIGALIAQTVQRLEQEKRIRRMARVDDLTGLANASHFYQMLEAACQDAAASGERFSTVYIDLDRFGMINEAFGRKAGNTVLRKFGRRLEALAPDKACVSRLGGDKFAVLLTPPHSAAQSGALAEQVLTMVRTPFLIGEHALTLTASIAVSVYPDNGSTCTELLQSAGAAARANKEDHAHELSFIPAHTLHALEQRQSSLVQQLTIETEMHRALENDEFFLEYQPVFDTESQRMVAVEALIRWRRANGEIVRPDIFIPIAEQTRLILQIGRWVLKRACADLPLLHRAGFTDLQVNVNMAAQEFTDAGLPAELQAMTASAGLLPRHLCLELTENAVMKHPDQVMQVMLALKEAGFKISLDDFGTGRSSLSRLKRLPISSLKIDRSFMKGVPVEREDCAIVRTVLDLGRHMKLQVIAEGVETDAQLSFLRQFGGPLVQGFLLSRPLPVDELIRRFE